MTERGFDEEEENKKGKPNNLRFRGEDERVQKAFEMPSIDLVDT